MKVSIAIADDSNIFRYALKKIVGDMQTFEIILEASNGKNLIDQLECLANLPEIIILDIGMPVMDGYETIEVLTQRWPEIKVLAASRYHDPFAINTLIRSGARGFISKEESIHMLHEALLSLRDYGHYYSRFAGKDVFDLAERGKLNMAVFTPVEKKLLPFFCTQMQYSEIAQKLFTSVHTIETHKRNILKKTGIHSREGLMLFAIQNELFNLE